MPTTFADYSQSLPAPSNRRARWTLAIVVLALAGLAIGGWQFFWRYHAKRFQAVREAVLYRVGQPSEWGLRYLVRHKGVKTVISLQSFEPVLKHGIIDPGHPNGVVEADFVRSLGAKPVEWPLGDEAGWPWPSPWVFEEFFKLFDNPANLPVVMHCQGGRHRTGTMAALFRLEYDRWPVERALDEMYSFQFGTPLLTQEHNLRTYLPRPRPDAESWQALQETFADIVTPTPRDYETLVRELRQKQDDWFVSARIGTYLNQRKPFAICLVQRLIDTPDDIAVPDATHTAQQILHEADATFAEWAMAAALIADFGTPEEQADLLALITEEPHDRPPSPRYQAIVAGVSNRYTANRVAYLRPLLSDTRVRPEPEALGKRYCDTAVARLMTILDENLFASPRPDESVWDSARRHAEARCVEHAPESRLSQLRPPSGRTAIRQRRSGESAEGRGTSHAQRTNAKPL